MSAVAGAPKHLIDIFRRRWTDPARSESLALQDESHSYNYGQLYDAVGRCAGWLRVMGIRDGHRVAIAMDRSADLAILILGAMAAGAAWGAVPGA